MCILSEATKKSSPPPISTHKPPIGSTRVQHIVLAQKFENMIMFFINCYNLRSIQISIFLMVHSILCFTIILLIRFSKMHWEHALEPFTLSNIYFTRQLLIILTERTFSIKKYFFSLRLNNYVKIRINFEKRKTTKILCPMKL